MAGGETPEKALAAAKAAFESWMDARKEWDRPYPASASVGMSGKFVQRIPKSLHTKLVKRAKQEGVSLNTLVLTYIAEDMGRREGKGKVAREFFGRSARGFYPDQVILIHLRVAA